MTCQLLAVCLDANDPLLLARFWGGVLGWEMSDDRRDGVQLVPSEDTGLQLRFVRSLERKAGLNPWHLHLTSTSPEDQQQTVARSLSLGARHTDVGQRPEEGHVVLADPEDNEFCVIEPGNSFLAGCGFLGELTCDGSREAGYFWSQALGWPLVWDQGPQTAIQSPRGGPKISWDSWDGEGVLPKPGGSRMRFELAPPASSERQEIDHLISLGAQRTGVRPDDASRVNMADPDGREFRVLIQDAP